MFVACCQLSDITDVMAGRHASIGSEKAKKLVFIRVNLTLRSKNYTKCAFLEGNPDSVGSDGLLGSGEDGDDSDGSESGFDYSCVLVACSSSVEHVGG